MSDDYYTFCMMIHYYIRQKGVKQKGKKVPKDLVRKGPKTTTESSFSVSRAAIVLEL